jgi:ATP-dependent DNA helicase RecQ
LHKPRLGRWAIADLGVEPDRGAMNSAQRVAAVLRRYRLEADVPTGPVLLVDDQVVTGWTLTIAARALRQAGATEVLPLALATRS